MPRMIVEYVFDPPATEEEFDAAAAKLLEKIRRRRLADQPGTSVRE